jgi:hypothetical protein
MRAVIACLAGVLECGCAATPPVTDTPDDHPASPAAAESPLPSPSRTLETASAPQTSSDAEEKAAPAAPASSTAVYTCPMHKEVVSDQPGRCPKCGMKLVAKPTTTPPPPPGDDHGGHGGHS